MAVLQTVGKNVLNKPLTHKHASYVIRMNTLRFITYVNLLTCIKNATRNCQKSKDDELLEDEITEFVKGVSLYDH
jgi:hypothetical protein